MAPLKDTLEQPLATITVDFRTADKVTDTLIRELISENRCTLDRVKYVHTALNIETNTPPPITSVQYYRTYYTIGGESNHLKFIRYLLTKREEARIQLYKTFKEDVKNGH